jgi:PAS domain S-box-containing protein
MYQSGNNLTRSLTLKYVLALGVLAALAVVNYLILQAEIRESQLMASVVKVCGEQRSLIHRAATLAERLVYASDYVERTQVRNWLLSTTEPLESEHQGLMLLQSLSSVPLARVNAIYKEPQEGLDIQLKHYLAHLRALANAPNEQLSFNNEDYKYVHDPQTVEKLLAGLDSVCDVYALQNTVKTARLLTMALWSLVSTIVVLVLDGVFVFGPMVQRVRRDMADMTELNGLLEERMKHQSAEVDDRAEQLERSENALRESEALYRSLVDHLPLSVSRKDSSGRFTFVNGRYCHLLDRPASEILGYTDEELLPESMAAKHILDDRQVMSTQSVLYDVEENHLSDGRNVYFASLTVPLLDGDGNVTGTQTALWDITDRKRAEERALHSERLAAIGQMVAGVAHESRNALQQIQACIRLLEWELDGDASKSDLIGDLQTAQDRLHRLFDELQDYAAPLKVNSRCCNVSEVLSETWDLIEAETAGREISFVAMGSDVPPDCLVDPFQLEQVFRNILENALAACEDPVVIEVTYEPVLLGGKPGLEITIHDNGPGLTSEQQERIFEPFFTTKTRGTGLGMAIVKRIIDAHGGTIKARNHATQGSEIVITLPAALERDLHPTVYSNLEAQEHELD